MWAPWKHETSEQGQTRVTISANEGDALDGPQYVTIEVTPWGGEQVPELPIFPIGHIYEDRDGFSYTITRGKTVEFGDGEVTAWGYRYLAVAGVHDLRHLPPLRSA